MKSGLLVSISRAGLRDENFSAAQILTLRNVVCIIIRQTGLRAFVDSMVNENVSLVVSRQLFTDFGTRIQSLEDSVAGNLGARLGETFEKFIFRPRTRPEISLGGEGRF